MFALLVGVFLALAPREPAEASTEALRWVYPDPQQIDGFRVLYGPEMGYYTRSVDVGLVFSYDLQLAAGDTCYVAVVAYAGAVESPPSNERLIQGIGGGAGQSCKGSPDWREDFDYHATGTWVPGWYDSWPGSLSEGDVLFSVVDLGPDRSFFCPFAFGGLHSHSLQTGAEWRDYDLRARVRISTQSAEIGITSHSRYPFEAAYYLLARSGAGAFALSSVPANPHCDWVSTGVVPQVDAWYHLRLEVWDSGVESTIRAKAWPAHQPEPSGWQAACSDTRPERPSSGTVGVWSAGIGAKYWDDFEVRFLEPTGER